MSRMAQLPPDSVLFTQITMEVAEAPRFLRQHGWDFSIAISNFSCLNVSN
jgi:hypothetical protein